MASCVLLRSSGEACLLNDCLSVARCSQTLTRCTTSFSSSPSPFSSPFCTTTRLSPSSPVHLHPPSRTSPILSPYPFFLKRRAHWDPFLSWFLRKQFHHVVQGRYICHDSVAKVAYAVPAADSSLSDCCSSDSQEEEETRVKDCGEAVLNSCGEEVRKPEGYLVVNFYVLVDVEDPQLEVARHRSFMQDRDICGRIYISHQGINAQYSGPTEDVFAYADWVKEDPRFAGLYVQVSPSFCGHAFPRLRLRYKPSLVQVEGGTIDLPLTDPSLRAVPLTPREWKERLDAVQSFENGDALKGNTTAADNNSCGQRQRKILLLDVRNGYEWDIGHFKGAQRPEVDCFKSTGFGLSNTESNVRDPLAGVDKECTDVLMYCTGGIRCDVYSAILRQKGFNNLYSLKGGVARYLIEESHVNWQGNLFVFDSRLSVPPKYYKTDAHDCNESIQDVNLARTDEQGMLTVPQCNFGSCSLCQGPLSSIRHRNCANLDCNQLFLSCDECAQWLKGCCSLQCTSATRLRPFFSSPQQYKRWYEYRTTEQPLPHPPGFISRRAMKRRLRREHRKNSQSATFETENMQMLQQE